MEWQESKRTTRDGLIVGYRSYVEHLVGQLMRVLRLPQNARDEFIAAGYLGLVEAAERFKFDSGADFKTFAYLRIRGAVIDSIRQNSALSTSSYRFARAFKAAQILREEDAHSGSLRSQNGQQAISRVLDYAAKGGLAFRLSYHDLEKELGSEKDAKLDPEQSLQHRQQLGLMVKYLKKLPLKERKVIEYYYFNDLTFDEIAVKRLKVSKSWVSRLHDRALSRLKELYEQELAA